MAIPEYIPQYILTTENYGPKGVVTAEHWNEIFNLLISQGNASAKAIADLIAGLDSRYIPISTKDKANGVPSLDSSGKVPYSEIPTIDSVVSTYLKTLSKTGWTGNIQSITVPGVTTSNIVLVSATPDSIAPYMDSLVRCTEQTSNTLKFTADSTPVVDMDINIILIDLAVQ